MITGYIAYTLKTIKVSPIILTKDNTYCTIGANSICFCSFLKVGCDE